MKRRSRKAVLAVLAALCVCIVAFGWNWYDNNVDRSGWKETEQGIFYQDFHGKNVTGWQTIDSKLYYFSENGLLATGWLQLEDGRYYLGSDGAVHTGWTEVEGLTYCFGSDGKMLTGWVDGRYLSGQGTPAAGWLDEGGSRYYLADDGTPITGRSLIDDNVYYFQDNGSMLTGWAEFSGSVCYFTDSGIMATGWQEIGSDRFYFREDGTMHTGWLELGEYRYYLHADGKAAAGPTEIDGETYYFTPKGIHVVLVNPWHYIPDGYEVTLASTVGGHFLDAVCVEALERMLSDCEAAGHKPVLSSSYRAHSHQVYLYNRKVNYWIEQGYGEDYARVLAGRSVAVPGTSEHQLGLAVDIVDSYYTIMDEAQSDTETQKWLMEHCWEYGFILRYLSDKSEITGIIFEPWHYRYVGTEVSMELKTLGITLEEYLGAAEHE